MRNSPPLQAFLIAATRCARLVLRLCRRQQSPGRQRGRKEAGIFVDRPPHRRGRQAGGLVSVQINIKLNDLVSTAEFNRLSCSRRRGHSHRSEQQLKDRLSVMRAALMTSPLVLA